MNILTEGRAFVGATMRITGEIFTTEEMRIDGHIEGRFESRNRLTIGAGGEANASIKAQEVDVAGSVKGNVEAVDRIILRNGANLIGNVKTAGIVIEDGAYFKGGIDIARSESPGSP
jgi:cytoskeletal protein CcmA (bactofilin family)